MIDSCIPVQWITYLRTNTSRIHERSGRRGSERCGRGDNNQMMKDTMAKKRERRSWYLRGCRAGSQKIAALIICESIVWRTYLPWNHWDAFLRGCKLFSSRARMVKVLLALINDSVLFVPLNVLIRRSYKFFLTANGFYGRWWNIKRGLRNEDAYDIFGELHALFVLTGESELRLEENQIQITVKIRVSSVRGEVNTRRCTLMTSREQCCAYMRRHDTKNVLLLWEHNESSWLVIRKMLYVDWTIDWSTGRSDESSVSYSVFKQRATR